MNPVGIALGLLVFVSTVFVGLWLARVGVQALINPARPRWMHLVGGFVTFVVGSFTAVLGMLLVYKVIWGGN